MPRYSVLMSVYEKDKDIWLRQAIGSMVRQTLPPHEIVLVKDGALPASLENEIERWTGEYPQLFHVLALEKNGGLANAMRLGVEECRCEWIARMDADDISAPQRCEKELTEAVSFQADIVGCDCGEFIDTIEAPVSRRVFPQEHEALVAFSRRRTPFCHPAVMMKKAAVLQAGNYQDLPYLEDYDLFVRMLANGAVGRTVKEELVYVRVGRDFYSRRGGAAYVKTLLAFNIQLLKSGWMSPKDFLLRSGGNVLVGLAPGPVRNVMYRRLLRK